MRSRIIRLASATLVLLFGMSSSAVIHTTPAAHADPVRYASAAYMFRPRMRCSPSSTVSEMHLC